jgi:hypothetical protein
MQIKLLTTKNATDRLITSLKHLRDNNLDPEVVYALEDREPRISFNRSMQHILQNSDGTLLLFEDDVELKRFGHFDEAVSQLPEDWELCYLGANLTGPVEKYSNNLYRVFSAWTTHAVMYNNPKKLIENYRDTSIMFDDWLSREIIPRGNSYIIAPMMAWQRPSQSKLWGGFTDYTQIFNGAASKLI